MANAFRFYFCGACGAMSVNNFRDSYCLVCHCAMKCRMVEVCSGGEDDLMVIETEAPHTEDE